MIYAQLVYKICLLNFRDILCLLDRIFLLRKQWGGNSANWKTNDLGKKEGRISNERRTQQKKHSWVKRERN